MSTRKTFIFFILLSSSMETETNGKTRKNENEPMKFTWNSGNGTQKNMFGKTMKRIRLKSGFLGAVKKAEKKLVSMDKSVLMKRKEKLTKQRQVPKDVVVVYSNFAQVFRARGTSTAVDNRNLTVLHTNEETMKGKEMKRRRNQFKHIERRLARETQNRKYSPAFTQAMENNRTNNSTACTTENIIQIKSNLTGSDNKMRSKNKQRRRNNINSLKVKALAVTNYESKFPRSINYNKTHHNTKYKKINHKHKIKNLTSIKDMQRRRNNVKVKGKPLFVESSLIKVPITNSLGKTKHTKACEKTNDEIMYCHPKIDTPKDDIKKHYKLKHHYEKTTHSTYDKTKPIRKTPQRMKHRPKVQPSTTQHSNSSKQNRTYDITINQNKTSEHNTNPEQYVGSILKRRKKRRQKIETMIATDITNKLKKNYLQIANDKEIKENSTQSDRKTLRRKTRKPILVL